MNDSGNVNFLQILTYRMGISHKPCRALGLKLCVAKTALSKYKISLSFSAEIKCLDLSNIVILGGFESVRENDPSTDSGGLRYVCCMIVFYSYPSTCGPKGYGGG